MIVHAHPCRGHIGIRPVAPANTFQQQVHVGYIAFYAKRGIVPMPVCENSIEDLGGFASWAAHQSPPEPVRKVSDVIDAERFVRRGTRMRRFAG